MKQLHGFLVKMLAQVDRGDNKVTIYDLPEVAHLGSRLLDEKKGDAQGLRYLSQLVRCIEVDSNARV
ncbi:MAG TPA: hypothetical protein VFB84_03625 [Micromonosporaceae bacterium]|nr:hypothetical protein [Micromonosporaceae bacterium]